MLNIAIITYMRAYNYGSALQAYALNKFLRNCGYDVNTIDYTTQSQQRLYNIFEPIRGLMSIARNLQSLLNYSKLRRHKFGFDTFLSEFVPMTEKISSDTQLEMLNNQYNYFICGSDQIWNVDCDDFDSNYMLSFVKDKNRCIAYAPSLGAGANGEKTYKAVSNFTSSFKALSSRETSSAEIISRATSKKVENVVDPVFLLKEDEWTEIIPDSPINGKYILGYFIGDVAGLRDFASRASKEMKLPVVVIYKSIRDLKYHFINRYDAGPLEFIALLKNASLIITNSFHAVSFSLIFKKPFWVFENNSGRDTRISGLLNIVGLTSRILSADNADSVDTLKPLDYSNCNMSSLESLISNSNQFLTNNLS